MSIGTRVEYEGARGTIQWSGELPEVKGQWIGVDWDDETRGKHDGSHKSVHYFYAAFKTSGSFVRPSKISFGVDLESAVRERYQSDYTIEESITSQFKRNIKASFVEVVGMEKVGKQQSALNCLHTAVLDGWSVNGGGTCDLRSLLSNLRHLDVSNCLLATWVEVARIVAQLPLLKLLNVSGNSLQLPEDPSCLRADLGYVEHLVLNRMVRYTWQDLINSLKLFSHLSNLQMAFNNLNGLGEVPRGLLDELIDLDLGMNCIDDWGEICRLGALPKLEILNLNGCQIKEISFNDVAIGERTPLFAKLRSLMVAKNPLELWRSVGELDKLASLTDLILSNEAVEGRENRFLEFTFGRIRNLKTLNRTSVTPLEKKDYQIFYLRTFGREYYENGGAEDPDSARLTDAFELTHPTYLAVAKICGAPADERGHVPQKSRKLRDLKMELTILRCGDNTEDSHGPSLVKNFLPSTKIAKLKMMIRRALTLPANSDLTLLYCPDKNEDKFEIELDNDMKDLHFYSMQSGDLIKVKV